VLSDPAIRSDWTITTGIIRRLCGSADLARRRDIGETVRLAIVRGGEGRKIDVIL
jgi:hypothetical protein